jgi:probable addiction module antidote protein
MALQLTTFDVADYLDSEEAIAEYLSQVMAEGDDDEFLRALGHVAKARGMSQLAKDAGVGRESLYKALKPGATPGYATVGKVVRALGFRMAVKPVAKQKATAAAKKPAKPKTSVAVSAAKKAKSAAAGAERLKGTRARA